MVERGLAVGGVFSGGVDSKTWALVKGKIDE